MHVIVGNVNDTIMVFGLYDDEDQAKRRLADNGYSSDGGKYFGGSTGRNSTLFQVVEMKTRAELAPGM